MLASRYILLQSGRMRVAIPHGIEGVDAVDQCETAHRVLTHLNEAVSGDPSFPFRGLYVFNPEDPA